MNRALQILLLMLLILSSSGFDSYAQSNKLKKAQKELDETRALLNSLNKKTTKTPGDSESR